mgnify:CR=1 FL=1
MTKIAVFGAGTWGIALARLLAANGRDVTVWSAIPAELKSLSTTRRHPNLPGMELPAAMHYTADIAEACTGRDILLFAVPSPFVRATAKKAVPHIPEGQIIVDVAKGVEDKTLMTMSEIIEDELTKAKRTARVVALSGPTHAEEVARDMPTAIVAASADEDAAKTVQKIFNTSWAARSRTSLRWPSASRWAWATATTPRPPLSPAATPSFPVWASPWAASPRHLRACPAWAI